MNTYNQAFIRQKAREHRVKWTRHALNELASETASVGDVETALQQAQSVIGINQPQDYILIVTVYQPRTEEWNDDWRTRK